MSLLLTYTHRLFSPLVAAAAYSLRVCIVDVDYPERKNIKKHELISAGCVCAGDDAGEASTTRRSETNPKGDIPAA